MDTLPKSTRVIVVMDTTIISNFARIEQIPLLRLAVEPYSGTTEQVVQELNMGIQEGYLPFLTLDWLQVWSLTKEEQATFRMLQTRFGAGEASCLSVARHRGYLLATDDLSARRYAFREGIPISGTLGILVDLVRNGHVALGEANGLLAKMILHGYYSPIKDLAELL